MHKLNNNYVYIIIIFFLFGILFQNFLQKDFIFYIILIIPGILILLSFSLLRFFKFFTIFFVILGFSFGISFSHYESFKNSEKLESLNEYFYIKQNLKFEVIGLDKKLDFNSRFIVKFLENDLNGVLYLPRNLDVFAGDIIEVNSSLGQITNTSENFNYEKFLLSKRQYFQVFASDYKKLETLEIHFLKKKILNFRESFLEKIYLLYPNDEAILLGGILIGARDYVPAEMQENFNKSSLSHITAVSGFNITILIIFFSLFIGFLPKYVKFFLMSIFIILFIMIVGLQMPVLRAGIMGIIGYFAVVNGRKSETWKYLVLSIFAISLWSPLSVGYDTGLSLSVMAVLGILFFEEYIRKLLIFVPNFLAIREAISVTLSALILNIPIFLISFGYLSLTAPFSNLIVVWIIPLIMITGFLSVVFSYFWFLGAEILSFITFIGLKYIIEVANIFGNIDSLIFEFDGYHYKEIIFASYVIIFFLYMKFFKK